MSRAKSCPDCGAPIPNDAPKGYCPACLIRLGADALLPAGELEAPERARGASGLEHAPAGGGPVPTLFGGYELLGEIGRGGMGVVYRARQLAINRVVALKMLLHGRFSEPAFIERFRLEAEAAAHLDHPNIVPIYEVGQHEGQPFYSMKLIEGQSLERTIAAGPLAPMTVAELTAKLARAVHYAHQHGVLHRDIKPHNILLDAEVQPHLTDFGLAKLLNQESGLTLSAAVIGSPGFMAPEQAAGKTRRVTTAADVYGLGAVLYALLTGKPVFHADTPLETVRQVIEQQPVRPRVLNPAVDHDLETICLKCLQKEPSKRYASAQALAEDLECWLRDEPIQARRATPVERVCLWCRRQPVRAGLIAALVAVALSGVAAVLWQWRRAEVAREVAEQAQRELVEKLWASHLAEARASRWSGRAGRRFTGLEAIRQAAAIRPTLELRNEAIACLTLADVRVQSSFRVERDERVTGLAFDENFERYARAYEDSSVTICRVSDHRELLKLPARGRIETCRLLFSPRGQFLAQRSNNEPKIPFAVWELARGRIILTVPYVIWSMCFGPDEQQIALAEREGKVHFHDLATGTQVGSLAVPPGVNAMAFDPAGERLAISRVQSPSVVVLDLNSKTIIASLTNAASVAYIAWSPDGNVLACPASDERVYLWNVTTGERKALVGHIGVPTAAVFNHLGDMVFSSGWDGVTWFWDPALGQPLLSLPGGGLPNGFDPGDRRLGFGVGASQWGIWEVEPARECRRLGRTAALWDAAFTTDGRVLATASSDGVRLWHVPLNRLLAHLPVNEARSVIWHPNGTNLITSGVSGVQLRPVEFSSDVAEVRIGPVRQLSSVGIEQARLTADGHVLLVAFAAKADLLALDLEQTDQPKLLTGHTAAHFLSISPDEKWFATGTWHGTAVKVWSTKTWQPFKELAVNGNARCLFSPDGKWLLTGSPEEYCLWQAGSWEPTLRISRDQAGDMYGAMALDPDAHLAAVLQGRNRGVKLISLPEGRELANLDTGEPFCFSQDGSQLATAGEDRRSLLVWDLRLIRQQLRAMNLDWD